MSSISVTRYHLEVVEGHVVVLWCVFILFVVALAVVVKIFNVKTIGITITIVVVILSSVGIFC